MPIQIKLSLTRRRVTSLTLITILVLCVFTAGFTLGQSGSSLSTLTLAGGPQPGAPTYTIFTETINNVQTYYAKDAYGAISLSSTNAATIINTASTNGGTIKIQGTIILTTPITPKNNTYFDLTQATITQTNTTVQQVITSTSVTNVTLQGGKINGGYTYAQWTGLDIAAIHFISSTNININQVIVTGNNYGIFIDTGSSDCSVTNCYITVCGTAIVNQASRGTITSNTAYNNYNEGIATTGNSLQIVGNTVDSNGYSGIYVYNNAANITISSNSVTRNNQASNGQGIFIIDSQNIVIIGNIVSNDKTGGITLEGTNGCIISSNSISNCNYQGISLTVTGTGSGNNNTSIKNNNIHNNGRQGINVYGPQNHTSITTNDIYDNGINLTAGSRDGLYISGINATNLIQNIFVQGNKIYETRTGAARTQQTGIIINNFCENAQVLDNSLTNNLNSPSFALGTTYGTTITKVYLNNALECGYTGDSFAAGTSIYTIPEKFYDVMYILLVGNGISDFKLDGISLATSGGHPWYVKWGHTATVTWSSSAPVFQYIPQ